MSAEYEQAINDESDTKGLKRTRSDSENVWVIVNITSIIKNTRELSHLLIEQMSCYP